MCRTPFLTAQTFHGCGMQVRSRTQQCRPNQVPRALWLEELRDRYSDAQLIDALGIKVDGRFYLFQTYRYERLGDAVNYALQTSTPAM
jgi:hypothetical protein